MKYAYLYQTALWSPFNNLPPYWLGKQSLWDGLVSLGGCWLRLWIALPLSSTVHDASEKDWLRKVWRAYHPTGNNIFTGLCWLDTGTSVEQPADNHRDQRMVYLMDLMAYVGLSNVVFTCLGLRVSFYTGIWYLLNLEIMFWHLGLACLDKFFFRRRFQRTSAIHISLTVRSRTFSFAIGYLGLLLVRYSPCQTWGFYSSVTNSLGYLVLTFTWRLYSSSSWLGMSTGTGSIPGSKQMQLIHGNLSSQAKLKGDQ